MKSSHRNRIVLAAGALFFILGCFGVVGSWAVYQRDTEIERNGQRTEGHVTRKSLLFAADGDSDYNVEYWFTLPGGERVDSVRGLNKELWSILKEGEAFVVAYSAGNPNHNFPLGGSGSSIGVTVFISLLSMVFAFFGALLIAGFVRGRTTDA